MIAEPSPLSLDSLLDLPPTLIPLLETVALRLPDAPALVFEDEVLSYGVLHRRANRFARHLAGLGIGAESIVALALPRSVDMVVALLGVIKAGAVYMPLDVGLPPRRLAFQLNDSGAGLLVGDADSLSALADVGTATPPILNLKDESLERRLAGYDAAPLADCERAMPVSPDNLAYLIYTSGSTGTPKGAGNTHAGAVNRLVWMRTLLGTSSGDRVLEKTPLGFDISVWELLLPLISGATLVIARPEGHKDPRYIADIIRSERITIVHFVPSMLLAFLGGADLGSCVTLRHVVVSGEAVSGSLCHRCLADHATAAFWNLYGPTEASIDVSFWRFKADFAGYAPPIGGPIWNTTLYVLDAGLRPSPVGVQGDLYIAGVGLARGYVGRPGLTAERFIACPFGPPGARMYRTGDLARWREDGALDFLGRADHQIKLRGFRIELGEIEAALTDIGSVAQAVVVPREIAGDTRLAAYLTIIPDESSPDARTLRAALAERLPEYMIPSDFVILDGLPLTANGKIDRRALPAPAQGDSGAGFVAPRTPREALVCDLLAELTGVTKVGVDDNFFALGGHSLMAIRLANLLRRFHGFDLPLSAILGEPTPRAMAAALGPANAEAVPAIIPGEGQRDGIVTLSFGQVRSWVLDRIDGPSAAYNIPFGLRLQGQLDIAALGLALVDLVTRHMPLRTAIAARDGAPYGRLAPPPAAERILTIDDMSALEPDDREAALRRGLAAEIAAPFDLGGEVLLRARLFRLGETEHALVLILHHASADGASAPVIFRDLGVAYAARAAGRAPAFTPLAITYADHAAWQRRQLEQGGVFAHDIAYWRERLAGAPELLALPTDRPRIAGRGRAAGHLAVGIAPERAASLGDVALRHGMTMFAVLLAAFGAVLGRIAGREDILIGTPVAGRGVPELDPLVGFFVNSVAIRVDLAGRPDAATLLYRVRDRLTEALAHQETPFERVVESLAMTRAPGQNPVFQVMFTWVTADPAHDPTFPGIAASPMTVHAPTAKFDLTLSLGPTAEGGIEGYLEYDRDLFDGHTVGRWLNLWRRALDGFVSEPDRPVATLPLADPSDKILLQQPLSGGEAYPYVPVLALIAGAAAATPEAASVLDGDGVELSYRALIDRAERVAAALCALGTVRGRPVALAGKRGAGLIVGLLGILRAGAIVMPVDLAAPAMRLSALVAESGAVALVADAAGRAAMERFGLEVVSVDERLPAAPLAPYDPGPDDPAYLLYTSGSTGAPKGVVMPHGPLSNLAQWQRALSSRHGQGRTSQATPLTFDVAFQEIVSTLAAGGCLVTYDDAARRDPRELLMRLRRDAVTRLFAPFAILNALADYADGASDLPDLREIITAGEALRTTPALRRFFSAMPHCVLWNHYGPTETHVATAYPLGRDPAAWPSSAPIGRPIPGARALVLDDEGGDVPIGVAGELWLGGAILSGGYWRRPDLTEQRFITRAGERLYRTGDLVRLLPDGNLDFLGRLDDQVKIRGHRVEPGEVEAVLTALPGVGAATVVTHADAAGDPRLVAHVVAPGVDAGALRIELERRLPDYMVPWRIMLIDALPLTASGKIDRRALPRPGDSAAGAVYQPPRGRREALLCELFAELTGAARVGIDDGFFALGGHSLLAIRLVTILSQRHALDLPVSAVFSHPSPRAMAEALIRRIDETIPPIVPGEGLDGDRVTLSFGQVRLWALDRIDGSRASHVIPFAVRLRGPLDEAALGAALTDVAARHMPLRTVIEEHDGAPQGRLLPLRGPARPLPIDGVSTIDDQDIEAALRERLAAEAARPFDLAGRPPLRVRLFRLAALDHALSFVVHHSAADGASIPVLIRDLGVAYAARLAGRAPEFAPLAVTYADYAAWQRRRLEQSGDLARETAYWRARLAGAPEAASLPTDRPRLSGRARRAGHLSVAIAPDRVRSLKALAMARGATLFAVLLAAFAALLGRLARQEDIVVGCPVAGRATPELDPLIGFFVNTLALRIDLGGGPDAATLIRRAGDRLVEALTHQETPFERLVEMLAVHRAPGQNPLFQVMFAWQSQEAIGDWTFPGIAAVAMAVPVPRAKFDLTLSLAPTPTGGVAGDWEYDADVFDASTVARWRLFWERLLDGFVRRPDLPVAALPLLSSEESMVVTDTFNRTARDVPAGTIHGLFEQAAARNATSIALLSAGESVSYGELDRGGNRFARYLAGRGIGPESVVALAAPRSIELIASMIGVLKAGAAYLPLDPAQPPRRLRMMIADSGAALLVVADKALADRIAAETITPPVLALDDPDLISRLAALSDDPIGDCERPIQASPDNIAYVMYTSGSTGTPKGVAATHRGVVNLAWRPTYAEITPNDTVLHGAPAAFDASTFEIWASLLNGARLSLAEDGPADMERLSGQLERDRVTVAWLPAGLFDVVAKNHPGLLGRLRQLIVGGDVVSRAAAQRARAAHPALLITNGYGPTEATTFTSTYPIGEMRRDAQTIPIGRPIGNARMLILDPVLSPVPIGVVGEIYVAGAGLARGYVGSPGLTAERFIACPFGPPGARMYRTSDLGLWRDDGTVEFHGRADAQIKLRGFRVEPAEIEAALCDIAEIAQAAVVPRRDSADVRLVAYLVPHPGRIAPAALELRGALSRRLPEYMLPAFFVSLDALPLTPNGKVDRARLPLPEAPAAVKSHAATMTERRLIEIWKNLLGRDGIDAEADFFVLGGHSLLAIRFLAIAEAEFGRRIAAAAFFHSPTIKGVAKLIDSGAIVNRIATGPGVGSEQRVAPKLRLVRPAIGVSRGRIVGMPGVAGHSAEIGIFAGNSLWDYDVWAVSVDPQGRRLTDDGLWLNVACEIAEQLIGDDDQPLRAIVGFSIGGLMAWVVGRLLVAQGRAPTPIINLDGGAMHLHNSTWRTRIEPLLSGIDPAATTPMLLLHRQWPRRFAMIEHVDDDWRKVGVALQTLRYRTVCHLDFLCAAAIAASGDAFAAFIETGHADASTHPDTFAFDTLGGDLFRLLDGAAPPEARAVQALLRDGAKLPDDIWVGDALIAAAVKASDDELTLDIAARVAVKDPSSEVAACAQVCALLRLGRRDEAIALAEAWRREYPRKPAADALADRAHQGPAPSVATLTTPGFIDTLAMDRITGWAMDPAAPEEPVELELLVDGMVLLRLSANRQRPDLMLALGHSGCHAFSVRVPFPLSERQRRSVAVRRASDHGALIRAPGMIEPPVEAAAE